MKRSRSQILVSLISVVLALLACGERRGTQSEWPAGTLVIARSEALGRLLARLARLEGTPIAGRASAIARRLPDCEWVEGRAERGDPGYVWSRLSCRSADSELSGLDRARGGRDLAFALPEKDGQRTWGTLDIDAEGGVDCEIQLPRAALAGGLALMLPGDEPPGPNVLSSSDQLLHARMRPEGGLDVAALVATDGQADRLFRLKSEIFAGAVLDGTWEAAIYLPEEGHPMPRAALAAGFTLRAAAVAAMERFVAELQASWPVHRSPLQLADAEGACLLDLNILPDLAPCYVATDTALVIGWNAASLRKALAPEAATSRDAHEPQPNGGLVVELARFPEADASLARLAAPEAPLLVGTYPWRRLTARGERVDDTVRLRLNLETGAGA